MAKIDTVLIRKLREITGAPVMRVKKVLEETASEKKALIILQKEGFEKAEKREGRQTNQGKIFAYLHHTGKVASLVELLSETDFVARNELFSELGANIAMQVASMNPKDIEELLGQEFIKDPTKCISDLVKEVIAKTGENIKISRISRMELGR